MGVVQKHGQHPRTWEISKNMGDTQELGQHPRTWVKYIKWVTYMSWQTQAFRTSHAKANTVISRWTCRTWKSSKPSTNLASNTSVPSCGAVNDFATNFTCLATISMMMCCPASDKTVPSTTASPRQVVACVQTLLKSCMYSQPWLTISANIIAIIQDSNQPLNISQLLASKYLNLSVGTCRHYFVTFIHCITCHYSNLWIGLVDWQTSHIYAPYQ